MQEILDTFVYKEHAKNEFSLKRFEECIPIFDFFFCGIIIIFMLAMPIFRLICQAWDEGLLP